MGESSEDLGEDVDIGPVHALMAIQEPERSRYCIEVVEALAEAVEKISKMDSKIKQARAVKEFMKELRIKRDEILPVVFYMVKPQFRDTVQMLLEKFAGITKGI